jgi:hypothetical protein
MGTKMAPCYANIFMRELEEPAYVGIMCLQVIVCFMESNMTYSSGSIKEGHFGFRHFVCEFYHAEKYGSTEQFKNLRQNV